MNEMENCLLLSNIWLACALDQIEALQVRADLTMAWLASVPAPMVDLTVEIHEEEEELIIPESLIWDHQTISLDEDEDEFEGAAPDVWFQLNNRNMLVPVGDLEVVPDSEEERAVSPVRDF